MGSMMKANVPLRLIGAVSAGQSYTATRRKNAGADMLPGNGAFLFIKGLELYRFQSYFMDSTDEHHAVAMIGQRWNAEPVEPVEPVQGRTAVSLVYEPHEPHREPVFPLLDKRPLTDKEAAAVRRMAADGASKSELCRLVYSAKSGRYLEWINEALQDDGKIIRLKRTGTGGD
jgi:hypothetical protein